MRKYQRSFKSKGETKPIHRDSSQSRAMPLLLNAFHNIGYTGRSRRQFTGALAAEHDIAGGVAAHNNCVENVIDIGHGIFLRNEVRRHISGPMATLQPQAAAQQLNLITVALRNFHILQIQLGDASIGT